MSGMGFFRHGVVRSHQVRTVRVSLMFLSNWQMPRLLLCCPLICDSSGENSPKMRWLPTSVFLSPDLSTSFLSVPSFNLLHNLSLSALLSSFIDDATDATPLLCCWYICRLHIFKRVSAKVDLELSHFKTEVYIILLIPQKIITLDIGGHVDLRKSILDKWQWRNLIPNNTIASSASLGNAFISINVSNSVYW